MNIRTYKMGRFASFNTDFEYKFVFGIQPSEDITKFGGEVNDTDDEEYNSYYSGHCWTERDKSSILNILNSFGEGFVIPEFSDYENNIEGTYDMYNDLLGQVPDHNDVYERENGNDEGNGSDRVVTFFEFVLGCLIYHQLLYEPDLYVQYEL